MSADRTKGRKAKRAAAFNKEQQPAPSAPPSKRGRPPIEHRRLGDKPLAREAVIFHLFRTWLKLTKRQAATFAAAVGSSSVVIEPKQNTDGGAGFSFTYTAGNRGVAQGDENNALNNRRDKILEYGPAMIAGAKGDDLVWLQLTMQALQGYFTALFELNPEAIRIADELLRSPEIGWPVGSRAELILKDQRYQRVKIDLIDA
jgi:hypothetical protein